MKKVLILGANSYIGCSFQVYVEQNYPGEFQIDRVSLRENGWQEADWSGYDSILNVTGKAHADIGSLTEEEKQEYYAVNCELACAAAKKAMASGAGQYIYLSSIIVYGDSSNTGHPVHITKETMPAPSNFYGDSKWQAEQNLRILFDRYAGKEEKAGNRRDTELAVVRPPMIYGKGSKGNFRMLTKIAEKLPFFPKVKNQRSMLYIENLAEFLRLLVESGAGGMFLPQNADYVSTAEMVREIGAAEGKHIHLWGWMTPFVWLAGKMPGKIGGMVHKAFGSLTVDQELSRQGIDGYQRFGLRESVQRSQSL